MFVIVLLAAGGVTFNYNALIDDTNENVTLKPEVNTLLDRHVLINYSLYKLI